VLYHDNEEVKGTGLAIPFDRSVSGFVIALMPEPVTGAFLDEEFDIVDGEGRASFLEIHLALIYNSETPDIQWNVLQLTQYGRAYMSQKH
jgi:hypothetical protein